MSDFEAVINKPKRDQEVESLKLPPHSVEAEQSVLGGLMLDNQAWDLVQEELTQGDFYRYEHRLIFQAMTTLEKQEKPFDVITIAETLKAMGELENVGGDVYLFELSRNTPSTSNIKAYAEIVHERSVLRQLIGVANTIADSAYNPDGVAPNELLDRAEQQVFEIAEQGDRGTGPEPLKAHMTTALERIDKLYNSDSPITGMETGFADFDKMTSGLQESDLVIVAGRPSMGKTVFGINLAEHAALTSKLPVVIFSLEMPGDAIAMRMLSSLGRINQHNLRSGNLHDEDWPRITSAVSMLSEAEVYIDDTPSLSPSEVRSRARRIARAHGQLGLIVIDYLQLMKVPNLADNRVAEISEISRSLKALAKELKVPVVALSQLNRSLEQRSDRRPVMSDLRESGAIEQDADVIVFIYRDEVYNPETRDKNIAEIIIGKQRNGPIGKVRLNFQGQFTRFDNLADSDRYEIGD
ncbi:MAG: replicative DNA helicase [Legionellales bacterium]|nr:replicative DNA helicase [Legionellales bacterium]|tara:strand:- start:42117 stop:43517 length:1401 start_codon:yes stop_codon:yes gene_type:complete